MTNFEICARAVILKDGKILLCKRKNRSYYFFPGGHVEFGEKAEDTLKREIKEEINAEISKIEYIGTVENVFNDTDEGARHHEINLVFSAEIEKTEASALESWLEYAWLAIPEFEKSEVKPSTLKKSVRQWLGDKKTFWGSEIS